MIRVFTYLIHSPMPYTFTNAMVLHIGFLFLEAIKYAAHFLKKEGR